MQRAKTENHPLPVDEWMRTNTLISGFCTQNGWIDDDTVRWEMGPEDHGWRRVNVHFNELVMEGSGCVADSVSCFGQVDLRLDAQGRVVEARAV